MHELHLVRVFRKRIEGLKNKAALRVQQDGQWRDISWQALGRSIDYLAQALIRLGHQPQQMVGICARNMPEWTMADLGILAARGVVVPIYSTNTLDQTRYILKDAGIRILFVGEQAQYDQARQLLAEGALDHIICFEPSVDLQACPQAVHFADLLQFGNHEPAAVALQQRVTEYRMDDLLTLIYTSGTTGEPKGVMLSHGNLYTNSILGVAEGTVRRGSIGLHAAPMFHLADGAFMNALFAAGCCHVMLPRFDPVGVLQAIAAHGITDMLLVPTMIQMLVDHPDIHQYDLSSLQQMLYGASPISEGLLDRAMKAIPHAGFIQAYGMTELSPVATILKPEMHREKGRAKGWHRSAGRATVCTEVRVVDPEGNELPRGEVGEVVVRGPGVMLGYWNKPAETAAAIRNGWMHTGDGGRMDDEGYVFIVDRLKDMIVTGGENVYSVEVESVITTHPGVASCAVIGVPSEQWGETPVAYVVARAGAQPDAAELRAWLNERVGKTQRVADLRIAASLPRSEIGKVLKRALRDQYVQAPPAST